MSSATDLLALLRILPSPLVGAAVYSLARDVATESDNALRHLHRAQGRTFELREQLTAAHRDLEEAHNDLGHVLDAKAKAEHEIETLRSEAASALADDETQALAESGRADLRVILADVTRERDGLLAASAKHEAAMSALRMQLSTITTERNSALANATKWHAKAVDLMPHEPG